MIRFFLIFVAGGLGSIARYLATGWTQKLSNGSFPLGTLCVNVAGCLFVGFFAAAFSGRVFVREEYRIAVVAGFVGGFTTFSAFSLETFSLMNDRRSGIAALNVGLSVGLGLAAVWVGYRIAHNWFGV